MGSQAEELFAVKTKARETARGEQVAVLAEQPKEDWGKPLEGDVAHAFEEKETHIATLDKEIEALRKQIEIENAKDAAQFAGAEGRGDKDQRQRASLGELMKRVDLHSKAQIVLGGIQARPTFHGRSRVNRGGWGPTKFALDDSAEPQFSPEMPPMTAMFRTPDGKHEMFNLNTEIAGIADTFPTTIYPLVTELFESTALMRVGRVITTSDENELSFPVRKKLAVLEDQDVSDFDNLEGTDDDPVNANAILEALETGNGFVYVGEGKEIPTARQTFRYVRLRGPKAGWITPITHEFTRRVSAFDVESQLMTDAMEMIDFALGFLFMRGTGGDTDHSMPEGLRTRVIHADNDSRRVTGSANNHEPTYAELVEVEHAIKSGYAKSMSSAWLANWKTCGAIRRVRDDEGRPIYDTDPTGMFVGRIGNRAVLPDESLPDLGDNVKGAILFGDFSRYCIRMIEGLRVDYSFDAGFRTDEVLWRFLLNFDGRIAIEEAFSAFDCKNT